MFRKIAVNQGLRAYIGCKTYGVHGFISFVRYSLLAVHIGTKNFYLVLIVSYRICG